ncbi:DUF1329 domain-containing protein [Candidatus Seongchinamella marina]|nr:DUF1329 domain-containing protein [Candidatus Seongchinamella marina]
MRSLLTATLALLGLILTPYINAEDLSAVTGEFAPVLENADNPLLAAGATISHENVDQYASWLDEAVVESVRAKRFQITLGPKLHFPTHPRYFKATEDNLGATKIGREPGDLSDYIGGRPFTGLDTEDPQAGIKAAWNMRYVYAPDETETARFIWRYRDMKKGKLERTLTMYGAILRYTHRHSHDPVPSLETNPSNLFSALYLRVSSPQDIRNTQLLIHRAEEDTEPEQAWMYLNTQRRVKRIGTGQKTDAFLGSDIMIEDFLGYNGRIVDMEWTYLGSEELLLPMYAHNQLDLAQQEPDKDGYRDIAFAGKGSCFPNVTWQLRKVHRLEAVPKDPSHPLSRRHYVIDAATFSPMLTRIYDRTGELWKLGISSVSHSGFHSPENELWQGVITDGVSMIDLQAEHCTTLTLKSRLAEKPLRPKSFTTSYLRQMGR